MLSPSLSLMFSSGLTIIFRGFAKASAALNVPFGQAFLGSSSCSSAGWERRFFGPRAPVTRTTCLRDVSLGPVVHNSAGDLG